MFVGRTRELASLNDLLDKPGPSLIVVTGRRKVGKTRLILQVCKNRTVVFLQASNETSRLNFQSFKRSCLANLGPDPAMEAQNDWLGLLSAVAVSAQKRPGLIIILDNFSVLCDSDETLPLTIRTFWQSGVAAASDLKLVLAGSNVTKMIDLTRGTPALAQHALAGCSPEVMDLAPLPLHEAVQFFPDYSHEACIAAYAIFGGLPAYLRLLDPKAGLSNNIVRLLLSSDGHLVDEPTDLLGRDLRDIKVYASILRAIANGYRESGEIKSFIMGAQTSISISSYLEKLRNMRLITDVRAMDADPKARYIRFAISDPLTRFWNLFVQPHRLSIDRGHGARLFDETIRHQLNDYMMMGFEDVCRDYVRLHSADLFDSPAQVVGQTWGQGYNIPIAGRLMDRTPVFGACAWSTRAVGEAGADYLMQQVRHTDHAPENPNPPGGKAPLPNYVMFSRLGFTPEVVERARQSPLLKLVTPADILRAA
ncbi:MAG: ATP-binding protein [Asticcacaulis sp.]|uniref:ATP-binding protein n=1 Tax=Asticcacaulis sp. TaxID=1872648 RepID=UPI0039E6C013